MIKTLSFDKPSVFFFHINYSDKNEIEIERSKQNIIEILLF